MAELPQDCLRIAISSRALFALEAEHGLFERDPAAYEAYQLAHKDNPPKTGVAFNLISKLLGMNEAGKPQRVDVMIISRAKPVIAHRVFNACRHYELPIERGVFTNGGYTAAYARAFGAHLFLSANEDDVRAALNFGVPAARIMSNAEALAARHPTEVRLAFDGDSVLFSDQAEAVYSEGGLSAFRKHEVARSDEPLPQGPLFPFLKAVRQLQHEDSPVKIRTGLFTARGAPAHERALNTFRHWGIGVDEAVFMSGLTKAPFLQAFGADIFFDDGAGHINDSLGVVACAHVPYGVKNATAKPSAAGAMIKNA